MSVWVTWGEYNGVLAKGRYGNGRVALIVVEQGHPTNGEVIGVASVNLPDQPMRDDWVALKTYSENEGIEEALQPTGILKRKVNFSALKHRSLFFNLSGES